MSSSTERALNVLRELGFSAYEARVIVALNKLESATVAEISEQTEHPEHPKIHHANLYTILDSLIARGLVVSIEDRPRIYQFSPLQHFKDLLNTKVKQLVHELEKLQKERESKETIPALIYTIKGKSNIESKILQMLSKSKTRIILSAPSLEDFSSAFLSMLSSASNKGVKVKAILAKNPGEIGFILNHRIKKDSHAFNLVVDGMEALISMPDFSICGWADNVLISLQLETFLQQMWKLAKKV
jgi:sugar-specific transcriptional regulator TrmB